MVEGELIRSQKSAASTDRRRCAAAGHLQDRMPFQRLRSPRRSAGVLRQRRAALADYGIRGLRFSLSTICWILQPQRSSWENQSSRSEEGKVTLPLIYAMENGHRDARELVARVLEEKEFNSVRPETIVSLVHESGALDRRANLAQDYAQRAKACLNGRSDPSMHELSPRFPILSRTRN